MNTPAPKLTAIKTALAMLPAKAITAMMTKIRLCESGTIACSTGTTGSISSLIANLKFYKGNEENSKAERWFLFDLLVHSCSSRSVVILPSKKATTE